MGLHQSDLEISAKNVFNMYRLKTTLEIFGIFAFASNKNIHHKNDTEIKENVKNKY